MTSTLVAEYEAPGDRPPHRVGGQRVGARQVDQVYALPLELYLSFHLLYRDARPVGHLEVGAGVGVEQRGLAAVGVPDEPYSSCHSPLLSASLTCMLRDDVVPQCEAGAAPAFYQDSFPLRFSTLMPCPWSYAHRLQPVLHLKRQPTCSQPNTCRRSVHLSSTYPHLRRTIPAT